MGEKRKLKRERGREEGGERRGPPHETENRPTTERERVHSSSLSRASSLFAALPDLRTEREERSRIGGIGKEEGYMVCVGVCAGLFPSSYLQVWFSSSSSLCSSCQAFLQKGTDGERERGGREKEEREEGRLKGWAGSERSHLMKILGR